MSILGIDWASYDRGVADALNGEPADEAGNALYEEGYDGACVRGPRLPTLGELMEADRVEQAPKGDTDG